jgi:hypothetical protein
MSGVNCSDWNEDFDQALAKSIAAVSGGSILQRNVEVLSCADVENRRLLSAQRSASHAAGLLMDRKLRASQSVTLRVLIAMILEESGIEGITPDNAFSTLQTLMEDAVSSGNLQTTLNARLVEEVGLAAPVLAVNSFAADPSDGGIDVTRSRSPTSYPTKLPVDTVLLTDNTWFLVSMAAFGITVLLLVLFVYVTRCQKRGAKVLMTDPSLEVTAGYDGFTNIQDERNIVQKPNPDGSVRFPKVSKKMVVHDNQVIPFEHEFDHVDNGGSAIDDANKRTNMEGESAGIGDSDAPPSRRDLRKSLYSQHSEKMIDQEEGNPFSELRDMMRIEEMAKEKL